MDKFRRMLDLGIEKLHRIYCPGPLSGRPVSRKKFFSLFSVELLFTRRDTRIKDKQSSLNCML